MQGHAKILWRIGLVVVVCTGIFFTVNYVRARDLPVDQAAVEAQLEREVYGYLEVDGTGWIATQFGDNVILDHLILDPNPMGIPPEPRWQWSGDWTAIPATDESASVRRASADGVPVLFGQINDPAVVSIEVVTSTMESSVGVSEPGFLLPLDGVTGTIQHVRFLDAAGNVVHSVEI